jgi:hypothetical protein
MLCGATVRPRLIGSLLLAAALVAIAPRGEAGTNWFCELTPDGMRVSCRAETRTTSAEPAPASQKTSVNGTEFPLDAGRRWVVDLFAVPDDLQRLELLTRATICYRSPECSVLLVTPAHLAPRR